MKVAFAWATLASAASVIDDELDVPRYLGAGNNKHFEHRGIILTGKKSAPSEKVVKIGLEDHATVADQFSEAARVADEVDGTLDELFNIEKYSDTMYSFPTGEQMAALQQFQMLFEGFLETLDYMSDRAELFGAGNVHVYKPQPSAVYAENEDDEGESSEQHDVDQDTKEESDESQGDDDLLDEDRDDEAEDSFDPSHESEA